MKTICENEGVRVREAPACYLCETEGRPFYSGLRDRLFAAPGEWNLRRCPSCGLVWLDPMPIPQDIGKLYDEYFTHSIDDPVIDNQRSLRKMARRGILGAGFGYKDSPQTALMLALLGVSAVMINALVTPVWLSFIALALVLATAGLLAWNVLFIERDRAQVSSLLRTVLAK